MSTTPSLFEQAQLAEAAYADLWDGNSSIFDTERVKNALMDKRNGMSFSHTQADRLLDDWQLIHHQPNTESGYSATLFKNQHDGRYVYAIRGTEPKTLDLGSADIGDIVYDGLAIKQIVDLLAGAA